jgi:dTDP-glucose 4,6-dehydratase
VNDSIGPNKSTILITGGAGFIGSDLARTLDENSNYKRIFILDSFTYAADARRLESVSDKVEIIKGDVNKITKYETMLKECQYVVHMAAESHVDRSISEGSTFISSNIQGSYAVFEACRSIPTISLIHVSTDEVYGSIENGESRESDALAPSSAYSASKASSDLLAIANHVTHGQKVLITRCTNNFGPYQNSEKFLPKVINSILTEKPIPIYGNGLNQREWIHVSDHNAAILAAIENFKAGEILNIGSGMRVSNIQLARDVLTILGGNRDLISFVDDRKGHDFRYALNSSKIRNLTHWKPRMEYKNALVETVNWYKNWFIRTGEVY